MAGGAGARRLPDGSRLVPPALSEQTPVGAPCYCVMPGNRYVYGVTTADAYRGHVNPLFNPHQTVPFHIK